LGCAIGHRPPDRLHSSVPLTSFFTFFHGRSGSHPRACCQHTRTPVSNG
jgi:hypothetical protein